MGYILLRTAGERLADGGVRCCVIRQLDILKLFLMQVVRTDAYAPIRHRGSVWTRSYIRVRALLSVEVISNIL